MEAQWKPTAPITPSLAGPGYVEQVSPLPYALWVFSWSTKCHRRWCATHHREAERDC